MNSSNKVALVVLVVAVIALISPVTLYFVASKNPPPGNMATPSQQEIVVQADSAPTQTASSAQHK